MRRLLCSAVAMGALVACTGSGPPTTRDPNDTTAPTITLTVTASANTADGLETVAPGSVVTLKPPGGTALIKAANGKGVAWVELWMTQQKTCNGTIENPGLSGGPNKRIVGALTDTSAPAELTAGLDINLLTLTHGCEYRFKVWGKAANAATTSVTAQTSSATLVLNP